MIKKKQIKKRAAWEIQGSQKKLSGNSISDNTSTFLYSTYKAAELIVLVSYVHRNIGELNMGVDKFTGDRSFSSI